MNITILTSVFPPYSAGISKVAYTQARLLSQSGHNVTVLTPQYAGQSDIGLPGISVIRVPPRITYGNAALIPSLDKYIPVNTNIVHVHYPFIGAVRELLLWHKKNRNIPIVLTYHMDLVSRGLKGVLFAKYRERALAQILSIVSRVHVTSFDYARSSQIGLYLDKLRDRVCEIPLSVNTDIFTPLVKNNSFSIRKRFNLSKNSQVALMVCALDSAHSFKGVEIAIKAIKNIENQYLIIVGKGDRREYLEGYVKSKGAADKVHFAGYVSDDFLPLYYNQANVLLLPSTSASEAFGIVLVESLSCGRPVIASNLPGVRSVFDDNITGFAVEPGSVESLESAIKKLNSLSDSEYILMCERARERAKAKYTHKAHVDSLLGLYDQCGILETT